MKMLTPLSCMGIVIMLLTCTTSYGRNLHDGAFSHNDREVSGNNTSEEDSTSESAYAFNVNVGVGRILVHGAPLSLAPFRRNVFLSSVSMSKRVLKNGRKYELIAGGTNLNSEYLGKCYYLLAAFSDSKRIVKWERNWSFGVGVARFDTWGTGVDGFENPAISSEYNIAFKAALRLSYPIFESKKEAQKTALNIFVSPAFHHFSNAATNFPNMGLNILSFQGGLRLDVGKYRKRLAGKNTPAKPPKHTVEVESHMGYRKFDVLYDIIDNPIISQKSVPVFAVLGNYYFLQSAHSRLGLGLSVMNQGNGEYYNLWHSGWSNRPFPDKENFSDLYVGLHVAYQYKISSLSFFLYSGINRAIAQNRLIALNDHGFGEVVYVNTVLEGFHNYNRTGFMYQLHDKWKLILGLQTKYFAAQFPFFGISYKIYDSKKS